MTYRRDRLRHRARLLLDAIYLKYHYDFRGYAIASLKRRLTVALERFGFAPCPSCKTACCTSRRPLPRLLDYLTVQVSDMFRDPAYFRSLRETGRPAAANLPVAEGLGGRLQHRGGGLFPGDPAARGGPARAHDALRHRHQYCSAGEGPPRRLRHRQRIAAFTENHRKSGARCSLSDHYTAAYGSAIFDQTLRRNIVFSDHSLATDSVFAEVQLVSCRNVLIYFNRDLQDRAVKLFADALCRRGFLGIGAQRVAAFFARADDFDEFVAEDRIYQRRDEGGQRDRAE